MITAIVNIELYRYEIHSLLKAFYPQEEVKVLTQADAAGNRKYQQIAKEPFLRVVFAAPDITVSFCDESGERSVSAPDGVSFARKGQECKTALKHLLYGMLADREGKELPWGELIGIRPTKIAMQSLLAGRTPEEAAAAMEREHLVSHEKAVLSARIAQREREILADIHYRDGYSLYIGIPFCPTTCLYCSFPSFNLSLWKDRVGDYLDALEKEMRAAAEMMRGRVLDTVYIGGGTPTTLEPEQLERLFAMLSRYFPMDGVQELTVEAGRPDSITREKLRVLRAHAVTRISVNPQTMNEETLRRIGRMHTVGQVRETFALCREEGFDNINMDIILGLPEETEEDVGRTLEEIEKLGPDSLTVHSLALKRGSRMMKYIEEKGFSALRNTDGCVELAARAAERMGMEPYYLYRQKNISGNLENVGYARPGKAGIYNILIMEEKQSILALGAGSITKAVFPHGRIERSDNCKDVATYMDNIDEMIERKRRLGIS
ncbi:MAG: coproporphyrinogen dehydrogenase HemZ [Eubacteriales bacterium]|nr:coproporphyrinogen dehydrogenase HemZ [Eubacteriales bacterium]